MSVKLPKEPFDPVLKAAMEEIKAVLVKYDIAGVCQLESKTHGEWLNHITPSWSCAFFEDEKQTLLRVRALLKDYPSKEARNEAIRLTTSMILGFKDGSERLARNMEAVAKMISKIVGEIEQVSRFDH